MCPRYTKNVQRITIAKAAVSATVYQEQKSTVQSTGVKVAEIPFAIACWLSCTLFIVLSFDLFVATILSMEIVGCS